eukprot:g4744.t2
MRRSWCLWRFLLLVVLLLVLDCAAKRPASATHGTKSRATASSATASRAGVARRRAGATRRTAYEKEDDFADWSGSESSGGDYHGTNSNGWDSCGDDGDEEEDEAASDSFTDPDPLDYHLDGGGASSYSREEDGDDLWSDNDDYDDGENTEADSWAEDISDATVAPRSRRSRTAGGAPSRRPRPSAWTGDGRATGRRSSGGGRGRGRSGGARGSSAVARYRRGGRPAPATRGFAVRMPAVSGAAIASALRRQMGTAREAVEQAGSIAASTSKKLKREVKLAVSGSWESALLRVTWPDDLPPDETLLLSMVDAVQAFKKDRDVTKNSAEHRVLLRKLWAKMSEPDWRTVSKAVYLFHSILKDLSVEHHTILKIFLGKMSREWDKKTGCRYFDLDVLCAVNEEGEAFRSFVDRYGTYVFKRAEGFNARFQELDSMQDEEGWEGAVTTLAKAQKAIDLGMACQPEPEEETELTVLCLGHTATDVHQLWRRYHSALAWVLEEADDGDLFEGVDAAMVGECLDEFKNFYTSRYDEVLTFLLDAEELLGIYGLDVPDLSLPAAHDFDTSTSVSVDMDSRDDQDQSNQAEDGSGTSGSSGGGGDDDDDDDDEGGKVSIPNANAASRAAAKSSASANKRNGSGGASAPRNSGAVRRRQQQQPPVSPAPAGGEAGVVEGTCETGSTTGEEKAVDGSQARQETQEQGGGSDQDEAGSSSEDERGDEDDDDGDDASEDSEQSEESDDDDDDDEEEEDSEDSEDEGAVDEQIDDLTYFDDATQPDRSSSTDGEWER